MIEPKYDVLAIVNAVFTRVVFIIHTSVTCWKCFSYYQSDKSQQFPYWYFWLLGIGLYGLIAECAYAVIVKKLTPYKWVSPCILMYLCLILPLIWFLELYMFTNRVASKQMFEEMAGLMKMLGTGGTGSGMTMPSMPKPTKPRGWIVGIEQVLIFTLVIGRWMLPKGEMTRDEVTRLMMTYIGMSADIIGFFQYFVEDKIQYNQTMTYLILGFWSISLLQFAFIIIGSKNKVDLPTYTEEGMEEIDYSDDPLSCIPNMEGTYINDRVVIVCIIITVMQDLPFFVLRIIMTFNYNVSNYMHQFFMMKNLLVLMIVAYKLYGAWLDHKRGKRNKKEYETIKDD